MHMENGIQFQNPCKKASVGAHACNPWARRQKQEVPLCLPAARLAYQFSPKSQEETLSQKRVRLEGHAEEQPRLTFDRGGGKLVFNG